MEHFGIEYLANAFWQLPLLAFGAWLLLRLWKPGPATQHRIWLAVLGLALVLPLRGAIPAAQSAPAQPASAMTATTQAAASGETASIYSSNLPAIANSSSSPRLGSTTEGHWDWANLAELFASGLHMVRLSATEVNWILALWLAAALWGLFRFALAWTTARRLVRESREVVLQGSETATVLQCAHRLRVKMPDIRSSAAIAGPVVVGVAHPVLLWPEGFERRSDEELRAALCHEIAHIRRRDYATNLLCEAAAMPLKWHPVVYPLERRIRATREMACDAMAAAAMESETVYANCLLSLAQSMVAGTTERSLAAGLFNGNVMEERVMRLMQGKTQMNWRARLARGAAGGAAMAAMITIAAAFHVVPAMAQAVAPPAPVVPPVQAAPAMPPVVCVKPVVKPMVNIAAVQPVIELPAVNPAVHVSHVVVHVAPVMHPVIQVGPVAPIIQVAPPQVAPTAPEKAAPEKPAPGKTAAPEKPANHSENTNQNRIIITDGQVRELTPAERARLEMQLDEAQKRIAKATARVNSPEFRKQIEDAQAKALKAQTYINSAEFKQKMAEAQKQVAEATAKVNSPEFKKQIQEAIDASMKANSANFQKQMAEARTAALKAQTMINSEQFRKQMADAQKQIAGTTAWLNSPEFKKQIEDEVRAAQAINSAEIQKQMAEAQKQIADALAKLKAEQKANAPK